MRRSSEKRRTRKTADDREIWQVTEEDLETTEGESVNFYDKLMELAEWKVTDKEKENDLT